LQKLRAENEALDRQLQTARRQLEEETLLRVDLENRLQSQREELGFNKQLYEKVRCRSILAHIILT
jgi:lamin B